MASGYNRRPLGFDSGLSDRYGKKERCAAGPVRVLMQGGVTVADQEPVDGYKLALAAELREKASQAELLLWPLLKPLGFEHSVPLCGFYADFYHRRLKLVVEVDGPQHRDTIAYDNKRAAIMRRNAGAQTIRFPTYRVYNDLDGVIQEIKRLVDERRIECC